MGHGFLSINVTLHDTILVNTDCRKNIQSVLVTWVDTVENQADNNFLPCRAALVPELGLFEVDNISDILHDTVQGTGGERLIFVIIGNGDQQLCVSVVHRRAKIVTIMKGEFVGITRGGSV
jgi:hypothetical protein